MALWILSGTMRVSWYQKKHSPIHTYRGHQSSFISFLHLLWSMASYLHATISKFSLVCLLAWHPPYISSPNHCLHFCSSCPYHWNLFCCSTEIMSFNPSLSLNPLLGTSGKSGLKEQVALVTWNPARKPAGCSSPLNSAVRSVAKAPFEFCWDLWQPKTSPQSNLRRARRSSVDKVSTQIANYWDRTACCRHSKRVEPSRKIRLDSARHMRHMRVVCCAAAKMTTGWQLCCYCQIAMLHLFCFCTWISLQPPLWSWTWLYHKKGNSTQNSTM